MPEKPRPTLGLLTGISYQSGLDYYKQVNESFMKLVPKGSLMPPNPRLVMVSVDCDEYAALLVAKKWADVAEYLMDGVRRIADAGAEVLVICSNTAHLAAPLVRARHPELRVLHIADTTARAIRARGFTRVGLLGTEPTMREDYLKVQLRKHGVDVLVPDTEEVLRQIFQYIMDELGFGRFLEPTRAYFVAQVRALAARGAEGVIMGCTEIELLLSQPDVPEVPLFASAALHIEAAARVAAGAADITEYLPEADRAPAAPGPAAGPAAAPLVLGAEQVRRLLPMPACIAAVEEGLRAHSAGRAVSPLRLVTPLPGARGGFAALAAMPCALDGLCCCKTITVFPANAGTALSAHQGAVLLFEGKDDGRLLCIVDAHELTRIRTAAASAVATRALSRQVPSVVALLGTGAQAAAHVEALRAVRTVTRVRVWGRSAERARAVAAAVQGVPVDVCAEARDAVNGADIVCTLTGARDPVLRGEWLSEGAHVNAVGACTPQHRELDTAAVARARVYADTMAGCVKEPGDIVAPIRDGGITAAHVLGEVGGVLNGTVGGRAADTDVTLFESLGCAVEDLCAARAVFRAASGR